MRADMREEFDPIAWLKSRDPLKASPGRVDDGVQAEILRRVLHTADSQGRRRRSRRLIPVAAAAAVLTASGSVAAVLLTRSANPDPTTVACYAAAHLDANRVLIDQGDDPLRTCQMAWADPQFADIFHDRPLPELAVCALPSGLIAVFPGGLGTCASLGLSPASQTDARDDPVRQFNAIVIPQLDRGCVAIADVESIVREALTESGLSDWTVVNAAGATSGLCGSIAIEAADEVVRIVAVPPMPTSPT